MKSRCAALRSRSASWFLPMIWYSRASSRYASASLSTEPVLTAWSIAAWSRASAQRVPARFSVHDTKHLVDVGLVEPGAKLLEDHQGRLGIAAGLLEPLARDVDFGVIEETKSLEVYVPDSAGDLEAPAE